MVGIRTGILPSYLSRWDCARVAREAAGHTAHIPSPVWAGAGAVERWQRATELLTGCRRLATTQHSHTPKWWRSSEQTLGKTVSEHSSLALQGECGVMSRSARAVVPRGAR